MHALQLDCGRYSPDRTSDACQRSAEGGVGVVVVLLVVGLIVGYVLWRRVRRKYDLGNGTEAEYEAAREALRDDYRSRLEAGDETTREASRDWYDNTGSSWRLDVGFSLGFVILFGSLAVLIPFFLVIKSLTE